MKFLKIFLHVLLPVWTLTLNAQSPSFDWVRHMSGSLDQTPISIKLDGAGNIYTCGFFSGNVDFDPGAGTAMITATGTKALYISKLDPQGAFVWAQMIGSVGQTGFVHAGGMAVNPSGDISITGYFQGTIDFDPGIGTSLLTAPNSGHSIFTAKLNNLGNLLWVKQFTGTQTNFGNAIAIDASNNVYTTGQFMDTVDFDPGIATFTMASQNSPLEAFVSKLDASGNFVWARQIHSNIGSAGYGIAVDGSGNVITTGLFFGLTDFDDGSPTFTLNSNGGQDAYIMKLDGSGNLVWAQGVGGLTADGGIDLVVDNAGQIVVSGFFTGTVDLDPGAGTSNAVSVGSNDFFILKLDAAGNFLWKYAAGGVDQDVASGLAIGPNNEIYATGQFENVIDFDPSAGTLTLSAVARDVFISKWSAAGNFSWVTQLKGTGLAGGSAIVVDATTNVFSTGLFYNTVDFDGGSPTQTLTSFADSDIYIHKMSCGSSPQLSLTTTSGFICVGNSATLTAYGATTYSWNNTPGTTSLVVNPTVTTVYTISAADNNGCISVSQITQSLTACTDIESIASDEYVTFYPNPATDQVRLKFSSASDKIRVLIVMNSQGAVVMQQTLTGADHVIDTSAFSEGLYFLSVKSGDNEAERGKILVKRN